MINYWNRPESCPNYPEGKNPEEINAFMIRQIKGLAPKNIQDFDQVKRVYQTCSRQLNEEFRRACHTFFVKSVLSVSDCVLISPGGSSSMSVLRIGELQKIGLDFKLAIEQSNCDQRTKTQAGRLLTD